MQDFQAREPPALSFHVQRHDTEALGFDLPLSPQRMLRANFGIGDTIGKRRKDQAVAMQVGLHQQHRPADCVQADSFTSAQVAQHLGSVISPAVLVESRSSRTGNTMRMHDLKSGGDKATQDIGRIVD
ncbi:hypothetical protein BA190_18120 [Labrys sp. WJW]|nr:hypothetical protein BA190_18120 [Labrys sp. WJW]